MNRWLSRDRAWAASVLLALAALCLGAGQAAAQQIDLSHGGPIDITSKGGIEWLQQQQEVIAIGDAKAVRANVTVTADRLIAWYRKKAGATSGGNQPATPQAQTPQAQTPQAQTPPAQTPQAQAAQAQTPQAQAAQAQTAQAQAPQAQAAHADAQPVQPTAQPGVADDTDTGGNEVYRLQAEGHVHIYTQTDQVWGDQATYDLDQAVLVVTGQNLRLTTPNDVVTARDDLEYWSQRHMAVARGDAVVITNDGRRLQGDVLVAYTTDTQPAPGTATPQATPVADHPGAPAGTASTQDDPLQSSGKLQKVDVFGHVLVRTVTDTVTGDRAVYVPDSGIARVAGQVRITRGQNQLNGSEAIVNMKTGVSRLLAADQGRVQGLLVPSDQTNQSLASPAGAPSGGAQRPSARPPAATGKQP